MPNFYYLSFYHNAEKDKIMIKDLTDLKPLKDPHFTFMINEIEFMLSGQWDMWVKPIYRDGKLIRVEREVNCNVGLDKKYPELWILFVEYCRPQDPDKKLLPIIHELERQYWSRQRY